MLRAVVGRRGLIRAAAAGAAACGFAVSVDGPTAEAFKLEFKKKAKQPYELGRTLGKGAFAVVRLATDRATGGQFACKLVDKANTNVDEFGREVRTMREVGIHRHIVSLIDEFETDEAWALVMDLVVGGEVFDRLCNKGLYSENDAATFVCQLGLALQHLHERGIVHADLKPENLLLVSQATDADVKLCDFGLARFVGADEPELTGRNGTIAYMAPEQLREGGTFDSQVDLWAVGVIVFILLSGHHYPLALALTLTLTLHWPFILLSGYHPFDPEGASTNELVAQRVLRGEWSFDDPAWRSVSSDARSLISELLSPDPAKRPDVSALLSSRWVQGHAAPAKPLPETTASSLRAFNEARRTWRAAIRAAALVSRSPTMATANRSGLHTQSLLPAGAIDELRDAFQAYDADGNGKIEMSELQHVMRSLGAHEEQAKQIMQAADVQESDGALSFDEVPALLGLQRTTSKGPLSSPSPQSSLLTPLPLLSSSPLLLPSPPPLTSSPLLSLPSLLSLTSPTFEPCGGKFCAVVGPIYEHSHQALRRAFDLFDQDGNGTIDRAELRTIMTKLHLVPPSAAGAATVDRMFELADVSSGQETSFDEFVPCMHTCMHACMHTCR